MKEIKSNVNNLLNTSGFDHEAFAEDMKKNFSPEELAKFAGLLSLYEPLLQRAVLINRALGAGLDEKSAYKKALDEWVLDYHALNETVKALHNKESLH